MALLEDLKQPRAYPAPEPSRVDLVETHISWVFLTEGEAFKVKKPRSLGFLDFSTLERRKHACEEEVRLNARLAPNVYRGIVPVSRGTDGRHRFGGDGDVVDWAVRMERLPESRRADRLLAVGRLEPGHIDALARALAEFHGRARADGDAAARFGTSAAMTANVRENFAQAGDGLEECLGRDDARELEAWQTAFLAERGDLFAQRIAAGRVREGHGDLRLEHVYLPRDPASRFEILDCIEFNERFRFADVCADISFLTMDLAWSGRVDLAEGLLASYAREANDYDLYPLTNFYESYRAFVRGKISLFLAGSAEDPLRAHALADARRYFLLALSASRRSLLEPVLVAVGGVIASGKSTIAERIGIALSAPVVEADRTRKHMVGVSPTTHLHGPAWKGAYDPSFTRHVYAEVLRRAAAVLDSGRPVVLDASFRSQDMRAAARALARAKGVPFRYFECAAPAEVCRARLASRDPGASDAQVDLFDTFVAHSDPVTELGASEHVVLRTAESLRETLAEVDHALATWPRGLVS